MFFSILSVGSVASAEIDTKRVEIYKWVISPWLDKWFKDHSKEVNLADNVTIERKLLTKTFNAFEVVEGRDLYTVKVIYLVSITDRPANLKVWGLKEQEIVFWLDGLKVKDFFPAQEQWKEKPSYTKTVDAVAI